jgi:hypothetical protein
MQVVNKFRTLMKDRFTYVIDLVKKKENFIILKDTEDLLDISLDVLSDISSKEITEVSHG